jgi:hypothetical protein
MAQTREEEPICEEVCDFGVIYSLVLRQSKGAGWAARAQPARLILKVSWEEHLPERESTIRSCAFELDLARERLTALGRKGNSLPVGRFPAKWFCNWARAALRDAPL